MVENCSTGIQHCQLTHVYCLLTPYQYWCQHLRNLCTNKNKMV